VKFSLPPSAHGERDGDIDPPAKCGPQAPQIGDRVQVTAGLFAGRLGVCVKIEGRRVEMLLFMLGAQRQVELRRGAIEVV
jgi:transcription antitermination factor NusG